MTNEIDTEKSIGEFHEVMVLACRESFRTRWASKKTNSNKAKLIPITKPGKEKSEDVSKYRPISFLNIGWKILEKAVINRINHHVFSHDIMNNNQYGFTPQRGTINAAMALKDLVVKGLIAGEVIVLVSLNVKRCL